MQLADANYANTDYSIEGGIDMGKGNKKKGKDDLPRATAVTKKFAPTVTLALHKVTRTKQVVRNVLKEKKHQRAEVVFVRLAIWVNSI